MSIGKSEDEFKKFLTEQNSVIDKFLTAFEQSLTADEIKLIGSFKGNIIKTFRNLNQLLVHYGSMEDLNLSEPQIAKHRHQASLLLATHTQLIEHLSHLCVEIYSVQADSCFGKCSPAVDDSQARANAMHAQLLFLVVGCFHNFTDCGVEFCIALSRIGFLFSEFANPMLSHWLSKHDTVESCRTVILSTLGFMYNMFFRNNSDIYNALTDLHVVDFVMPYLKTSNVDIQTQSLVLIAFALDESKASLYESAKATIYNLMMMLNASLDAQDRRSSGYHTSELAVCINRLALNEVNKEILVGMGLLPVLHKMCIRSRDDEIVLALDVLYTLSFKEENQQLIEKQFKEIFIRLYSSVQPNCVTKDLLRNYSSLQALDLNLGGRISAACPSAVRPSSALRQSNVPGGFGGHVMISYQHEQKQAVMRIKEALIKSNVKVWIDYEQMKEGDTVLGLMAEAVEGSYAFLMCMSRTYKDSNNCRMEAEYAHRMRRRMIPLLLERGYKPNGWLGFILGMGLYYDFSGKYNFDEKLAEVLGALRNARSGGEDAVDGGPIGSRPGSSGAIREHRFPSTFAALPPITNRNGDRQGVRQWSRDQVQQWVTERGLPQAAATAGLTGEDLHFLLVARDRAPEAFYRMTERYLPVATEVADVARFVNALYEL